MANIYKTSSTCTISDLSGVKNIMTDAHCLAAIKVVYGNGYPPAHIFFGDSSKTTVGKTGGERLADFIKAHGLGRIVSTRPRFHPRHQTHVTGWLWTPPKTTTKALASLGIKVKKYGEDDNW